MRTIKNSTAMFGVSFFILTLLSLPVPAHAWSDTDIHPVLAPNFQGQSAHQVHVNMPQVPVKPQHQVEHAQPVQHYTQSIRHDQQPVRQGQVVNHDQSRGPRSVRTYFQRDVDYYGHIEVPFPYSDVDSGFFVPDGYETISFNGETFYYNQGVFYQQVGDQLTAIPAVLGAVVDSIPENYQIVMADGAHYLFTAGVYYQRVDQGFEVAQPPVSDQG